MGTTFLLVPAIQLGGRSAAVLLFLGLCACQPASVVLITEIPASGVTLQLTMGIDGGETEFAACDANMPEARNDICSISLTKVAMNTKKNVYESGVQIGLLLPEVGDYVSLGARVLDEQNCVLAVGGKSVKMADAHDVPIGLMPLGGVECVNQDALLLVRLSPDPLGTELDRQRTGRSSGFVHKDRTASLIGWGFKRTPRTRALFALDTSGSSGTESPETEWRSEAELAAKVPDLGNQECMKNLTVQVKNAAELAQLDEQGYCGTTITCQPGTTDCCPIDASNCGSTCASAQPCDTITSDTCMPMASPPCRCGQTAPCSAGDYCNGGVCTACSDNRHCGQGCVDCKGGVCTSAGVCGACNDDGDCKIPGLTHCDKARNVCVECSSDSDCATEAGLHCDTTMNACVCRSDAECPRTGMLGCDLADGHCLACPASSPSDGGAAMNRPSVFVPGGDITIKGHPVHVDDFYLDQFLVTVGGYRDCMKNNGCKPDTCNMLKTTSQENHPISCVTWDMADYFCKSVGRRLPTEREWVRAAGMGPYPWGMGDPTTGTMAQVCWTNNSGGQSCPVDRFRRTFLGSETCLGVADLAGNVYEWLNATYPSGTDDADYNEKDDQGSCAGTVCVLRGGSWASTGCPDMGGMLKGCYTVDYRRGASKSQSLDIWGFRCAH